MRLSANRRQAISNKVEMSVPFSAAPCFCLYFLKSLPVPHTLSNLFCNKIAYQPYHVGGPSEYVVSVFRNQTATLYINLDNSDMLVGFEFAQHGIFRIEGYATSIKARETAASRAGIHKACLCQKTDFKISSSQMLFVDKFLGV